MNQDNVFMISAVLAISVLAVAVAFLWYRDDGPRMPPRGGLGV